MTKLIFKLCNNILKGVIEGDMSNSFMPPKESMTTRVERAYRLLQYALNNSLPAGDDIITTINRLHFSVEKGNELTLDDAIALDTAVRDLTKVTYPTTVETIRYTLETFLGKYALQAFIVLAVVTVAFGGFYFYDMMLPLPADYYADTGGLGKVIITPLMVAILMGMIGAEISLFFNFLGITRELALYEGDVPKQFARIILGALVGYLSYILFAMDSFKALSAGKALADLDNSQKALLLLPFLMGYSVKLVFGVLNKAIKATQLTLGLEDKSDDLDLRNRQKQMT